MQVGPNINAINNIGKKQDVAANNIANINTNDFKADRAVQVGDSVQISPQARAAAQNAAGDNMSTTNAADDIVQMTVNTSSLDANVTAIQTQDDMFKALLDIKK